MVPTRVFDILDHLKEYAPGQDILNAKRNKQWVPVSLESFYQQVQYVSSALLANGYRTGDKVGIMSANLPEWNFVDYGSQQLGMPNVPIYPTIGADDLVYILNHSEIRILFTSDQSVVQKVRSVQTSLRYLRDIVCFSDVPGTISFAAFLEQGKAAYDPDQIAVLRNGVLPDDMFTLLYTSGTTGNPKGVMLSHRNILSNLEACKDIAPFRTSWRALSFLPLNHIYERFLNTLYLFHGVRIFYSESVETIGENAKEIQPQIFVAVPRVLERVLEKIMNAGEQLHGLKKKIFDWSLDLAARYELNGANGPLYEIQRKLADRLVFRKWRAAVGGKMEAIVSGGAALNPRLERIFTCAGLPLLQGYGMTESCVVIAVNRWEQQDRHFGTVGIVVENSEVRIDPEDGEILFRGPSVMLGYYKDEAATREAIDAAGWLHTGDVGTLVDGRFLKITDRKKEIFKNSAGKYIAPVAIENRLKESKYIEQVMVIGEGQKFASALIVVSADYFRDLFVKENIPWPVEGFEENELVKKTIAAHVQAVNAHLGPHEQIKRYRLLGNPWTVNGGEITPKLSLRRKIIAGKYQALIAEIFPAGNQ
ncbi:AMP-dependent synthetase/ligase [Rurimicrobium arvi]|uniref:AMP-dependent synthetase/ligase n=1 Tax=Rurimicrobium arvi TaxID=2049916 RepID=A0ABP8MP31_9BACT